MNPAQLRAILALPFNVLVTIPALLLWWTADTTWPRIGVVRGGLALAAFGVGTALMITTIRLLGREGRGTLAPWAPTQRLVVHGPYRYVRNPMISGVLFNLAAEALVLGSGTLAWWLVGFLLGNALYFPLVEEPGLAKRFGPEYERYRSAVPRWLPRLTPWEPGRKA